MILGAQLHNYPGNLDRTWLSMRRAVEVAQAMALHRGAGSLSTAVISRHFGKISNPCFLASSNCLSESGISFQ